MEEFFNFYSCPKKRTCSFVVYSCEERKMKCWNCHKSKKDSKWNPKCCPKCGLWLETIDLDHAVYVIDGMIERWNSPKQYHYYNRCADNHIRLNYKGIKKIISDIVYSDKLTFGEIEALIQIITYESHEFDYNITSLALNLFCFIVDTFGVYHKIMHYWIKRGIKEDNRDAYDYQLALMYSNEDDKTKHGRRKINKVKEKMRHLPNFVN